ncbi:hypothetical protein [Bacillus aquiflavi]|uniref:hypothetical protein n=1 Tax=Bacillus aquiflavi TaxID=2672567 RepID=UPI001FEC441A|nr:hypothetical protein [Bacillus aquiflavi]
MKLDYDLLLMFILCKRKTDIETEVAETVKYPVKDTDFRTDDQGKNLKRVADLEEGLYRKQFISYSRLL